MGPQRRRQYKIRLESGRVLGPIDVDRVRELIVSGHIKGSEIANVEGEGDWKPFGAHRELADLMLAHVQGRAPSEIKKGTEYAQAADAHASSSPTVVLPSESHPALDLGQMSPIEDPTVVREVVPASPSAPAKDADLDPTRVQTRDIEPTHVPVRMFEGTRHNDAPAHSRGGILARLGEQGTQVLKGLYGDQPTEMISVGGGQSGSQKPRFRALRGRELIKVIGFSLALGYFAYDTFLAEDENHFRPSARPLVIRAVLPGTSSGKADPAKSQEYYTAGLKAYLADHVLGYKTAAEYFLKAATLDPGNVKATAMLASCYLNLIDSASKDDTFFTVVSKLIEITRAKKIDLPETVMAEAEYLLAAHRPEAAQRQVVEYTKSHQNFGPEIFYYLSLAFYHRGDLANASKFINQIGDSKVFSARIPYLRGAILERLGEVADAERSFKAAIKGNPQHAKSHLRLADFYRARSHLKEAAPHIDFLITHPTLLSPKELARAFYLQSLLATQAQKFEIALAAVERSVSLEPTSAEYVLQLYLMRTKLGDSVGKYKDEATMYFNLSQGEGALRDGDLHQAQIAFLAARQARPQSALPLVRLGDVFLRQNDLLNARLNYKMAAERAPSDVRIWSKYIDTLVSSFEWEDAQAAMDRFRKLPVSQSALDKAAGDIYAKQGRFPDAIAYYKKALGADVVDSGVYLAFARTVVATGNFKDGMLLYALALRADPFSVEAAIGSAKCVAELESIDRAILTLQDEAQRMPGARSEYLTAMADLELQRGEPGRAQALVDQAMAANPFYAQPWKVQAKIFLAREKRDAVATDRALEAWRSYSERNPSDADAHIERYRLYLKRTAFEKASDELSKVYEMYPKYPNLHLLKGELYAQMRNGKAAAEEFEAELKNNPTSIKTLLAMGRLYVDAAKPAEAIQYLSRAIAADPINPEAKHLAGYANFLAKNYSAAIALYRAALVYDKGNPLIYKRLGVAYREAGDQARAKEAFQKYLEMEPDAPDQSEFQRYR